MLMQAVRQLAWLTGACHYKEMAQPLQFQMLNLPSEEAAYGQSNRPLGLKLNQFWRRIRRATWGKWLWSFKMHFSVQLIYGGLWHFHNSSWMCINICLWLWRWGWNPRNSMESRLSASFPSLAYSLPLVYFFSLGGIGIHFEPEQNTVVLRELFIMFQDGHSFAMMDKVHISITWVNVVKYYSKSCSHVKCFGWMVSSDSRRRQCWPLHKSGFFHKETKRSMQQLSCSTRYNYRFVRGVWWLFSFPLKGLFDSKVTHWKFSKLSKIKLIVIFCYGGPFFAA